MISNFGLSVCLYVCMYVCMTNYYFYNLILRTGNEGVWAGGYNRV